MKVLETLGNGIAKALDYMVDKNHKAALVNRIRIVIKNERENTARAYVALGKYYYDHLRDPQNEETERLCRSVEESAVRMRKAFAKLEELSAPQEEDSCCSGCGEDCGACPYYEQESGGQSSMLSDFFTGRVRFPVLPDQLDAEAADDEQ